MDCFFQENLLHPTVTQAAGDKIWHGTQRGSFVTSTFGWDPHHWIPHLGLIHSELARSWTHCSEWELKTADGAGVLWKQASATLSACKHQWRRRRGSHTDLQIWPESVLSWGGAGLHKSPCPLLGHFHVHKKPNVVGISSSLPAFQNKSKMLLWNRPVQGLKSS